MEEPVHLRPPLRQLAMYPILAAALFVMTTVLPPHQPQWLLFPAALLMMIAPAYGVKLTDEHLVYWRLLGRRRIRWSSINAITVRRGGLLTGVMVVADLFADRLWSPRQGWLLTDPDFDRKMELLRRWWVEHRGVHWTGQPGR